MAAKPCPIKQCASSLLLHPKTMATNHYLFLLPFPLLHLTSKQTCLLNLLISKSFISSLRENHTLLTSTRQDPTNQNHTSFLHLMHHCNSIESLKNVHSVLIVTGLIEERFLIGEIVRKYLCFDNPGLALSVYHAANRPTLFLENLVIRCLSDRGFYRDLLSLYAELQNSHHHCSDNFTFPFVIKACAALLNLRSGRETHCMILRTGYGSNIVIQTALLDMYAKTGHMESSKKVFDKISERDLISWNALLSGYSLNGFDQEALEAFRQIQAMGFKPSGSTFVNVIPTCTRLGALDIGKSLHGLALKCGAFSDESLAPTLISMYSGCEDLIGAKLLFEMLPVKDLVTWNAMISAYAQNGKSDEAFELFQLMHLSNTRPNSVTLVSVLHSCGNLVSFKYGESVHAIGIKHGLTNQISVVTALVSMNAKFGDLDAAQYLFVAMPEKHLLLWNSMVSGYLLNGLWSLGLDTFRDMQLGGVMPDAVSMVNVISGCTISEDLRLGKSAHAYSLRSGFDLNLNVMNALLAMYSDCNQFLDSLKLFHKMQSRNLISWNTVISACSKVGDTEASVSLFRQMLQEDLKFDLVTIITILPSFYRVEDLRRGMCFHAQVIKNGNDSDISLTNAFISMYVNCGDLEAGYLLFDNLSFKSVVSWNAIMTGCRNHNLFGEVMVLFNQMKMDGQKPNSVTLLNILPSCKSQLQGKSIHAYAARKFCTLESSLLTSTMCMYTRFDDLKSSRLLFEMEDKRNVVVWNTMMSVYIQSKHEEQAVASFREMLQMVIEPDPVTILTLVSACSQIGSLDLAQCVTGFALRKGFEKNTSVINSLIDMYARCGSISAAKELFDGLKEKDSISWSVMINGYGMHGNGEAALCLFSEMQGAEMEIDDTTFISILSACSHAGLVEEGRILFRSMSEKHHIAPRMEHYACMVDLYGRTGHLDEAYDLIKKLPFKPSVSMLESLLGACHFHGNTEVGEKIGKVLFECNPSSSRSYVMLSNIYAAAGRWTESGRLRFDMEARGLRKDPGVSLIEVK